MSLSDEDLRLIVQWFIERGFPVVRIDRERHQLVIQLPKDRRD